MQLPAPDYPAPAKLNLFLHVVGRRPDGYHLLQSVFTLIDLHDRVRLRVREDGVIRRVNEVRGVRADDDLAVRAARLLQEASGTTLGADVPFFLRGQPAWVEGIGEVLRPLELPRCWYLVLVPPVEVPTREIFAAPELTRNTEALKMEDFSAQAASKPDRFRNDLEAVATARYPEVAAHLAWLRQHGDARMTGSGGCVFARFEGREAAQRVLDRLPAPMKGFVAEGLGHHPLRTL